MCSFDISHTFSSGVIVTSLFYSPRRTQKISINNSRLKWEAERCYWLSFSSSEKAVPVHSGEQSRQQENDIISTFSPALPDHTKWFPICHPSYTPKKHSNTRLSHRRRYWISALFRLKSLKYKIVDCVHIRKNVLASAFREMGFT